MKILFEHVTALTMDPAQPELKDGFVSVEDTKITCAPAFATPAATVPTPASLTNFTEIRARVLEFFKS